MYDIPSTYYYFISVRNNHMERQYELTYGVGYLSFIDKLYSMEEAANNSGKKI